MPATVPPPRSLRASRRAPAWTPRLGLLVGLLAVFRAQLPTCHAATANPMDHDDPADTIASFSEAVMREAMWDMYDADTGAALDNSKAISLNVDAEDTDDLDLALFVDDDDHPGEFEPNSTQVVQLCEFAHPETCAKAVPYVWAPETFDCGESDESNPDAGFVCVDIEAKTDKDGDLAVIAETRAPSPMCIEPDDDGDDTETTDDIVETVVEEDPTVVEDGGEKRRRGLTQARQRRRPGNRSRHLRTGRVRGTRTSTRGRRG